MRGAMPDVECPRCSATFPPSVDDKLVTCATCGLVFTPHEVIHRPALVSEREPPPSVTVVHGRGTATIRAPLSRVYGALIFAIPIFFVIQLSQHLRESHFTVLIVANIVGIVVFTYLGLIGLVSSHILVIAPTELTYRVGPIPLGRARRIARADVTKVHAFEQHRGRNHYVYVRTNGRPLVMFVSRNREVAEFVAEVVSKACNVPVE